MITNEKCEISCRLCGSGAKRPLFEKDGYSIVKCLACGLAYVLFIPARDVLDRLYSESYFDDPAGFGYGDYLGERRAIERTAIKRLRRIGSLKRDARTLLEVGCGPGFFLNMARNFYDVVGVELSSYASEYARNHLGLNVFKGTTQEASFAEWSFDIVALWDVISHITDPLPLVKEVGRILRPSGLLAMSTPNVDSFLSRSQGRSWRLYKPPYHLHYFSPATIASLLDFGAFSVIKVEHTLEWHSLQYLCHVLCVHYNNKMFRALKKLTVGLGIRNIVIPVTLWDIMTVYAVKRG